MKRLLFCALMLMNLYTIGQSTTFFKTFDGLYDDYAYDIIQTKDTGFAIIGSTQHLGGAIGTENLYLIKTDKFGGTIWTKTYGHNIRYVGRSIKQTQDNGFIITGLNEDNNGYFETLLLKTNLNGDSVWTKHFKNGSAGCWGNSVIQTNDGSYILTGLITDSITGYQNLYIIKTNSNGDSLWTKKILYGNFNIGNSIVLTSDNNYFITGATTYNNIPHDLLILKIDSSGTILWMKSYPNSNDYSGLSDGNSGISINNGFITVGNDTNGIVLRRLNNVGDTLWTKRYAGYEGNSVVSNNNGYAITGRKFQTNNYPNFGDVSLIVTDTAGNIKYVKTWGDTLNDSGLSIKQTYDGGYAIAGYYNYGDPYLYVVYGPDMGFYLKTDQYGNITNINDQYNFNTNHISAFPNPATDNITIDVSSSLNTHSTIEILNIQGQTILQKQLQQDKTNINISGLAKGVYIVKVQTEKGETVKKFVKE